MSLFVSLRRQKPLAYGAAAVSISFVSAGRCGAQTPPARAAIPAPPAFPTLTQKTLPSGLRLIVQTRPGAQIVAVAVSVRVGTGSETVQNSGVAHFIEHMVFKGTANQKPGELDAQMESLGGELTARTSRDQTLYTATVPQANWQKALPVFADLLLRPAFRPVDLEAERRVIKREQAAALTEPLRTGFAQLAGEAYPAGSAYRLPLMGRPNVFAGLTAGDLRGFWQTWYTPQNMTLVVVGDVPVGEVEAVANALFPPFPAPPAFSASQAAVSAVPPVVGIPAATPPIDGIVRTAILPPAQQPQRELTSVFMGFFVPKSEAGNHQAALRVLARWLVRESGGTGRLEQTLVTDRHEAQEVQADYVQGTEGDLLFVSAIFAENEAGRAETHLADALRRLREDGVSEMDVNGAKQAVLGEIRYENETVEEQARFLAQNDLLHPAALTAEAITTQIEQVSVKDIDNVLHLYLTPARYTITFVGPQAPPAAGSGEIAKP